MKINSTKILDFIKSLDNETEFIYLDHVLLIRRQLRDLISKYKISKVEISSHFGIKEKDYDNFVSGAWNYDIETIAVINSLSIAYRQKEIEKEVPENIRAVIDNDRIYINYPKAAEKLQQTKDKLNNL